MRLQVDMVSAPVGQTARGRLLRSTAQGYLLAVRATLHCLAGCAIGEVLGMVLGTATGMSDAVMIGVSVLLAFAFGYTLTMLPLLRSGFGVNRAARIALVSDTASIASMELVDNLVIFAVPGALDAYLDSLLFWATLAGSLAIAFAVTVPVNAQLIRRGKGHATVHEIHA